MNIVNIRKLSTSFFFILFILVQCQATPLTGHNVKIVGHDEFPFVVSIGYNLPVGSSLKEIHVCGGSLITRLHVLTAGHCFEWSDSTNLVVKVGSIDLRNTRNHKIMWWLTYNQWVSKNDPTNKNENHYHDVAIAKMFNSVDSNIQLGVLTKQPDLTIYGRTATTAGWGKMENNTRPTRLRKVDLEIHYPDNCSVYDTSIDNNFVSYISANLLCTSATPPALVNCGDSGSPLFLNGKEIIGVNLGWCTQGDNTRIVEDHNLHASINYYRKFIEAVAKPEYGNPPL